MKAFGPKVWSAPATDELEEPVTTPCGMPCLYCQEAVVNGEDGFLIPNWLAWGQWIEKPVHTECWLRQVLGSIGHINGTCTCQGGTEEDPEGATLHEGALAVKKHLLERGAVYRDWGDPVPDPYSKED